MNKAHDDAERRAINASVCQPAHETLKALCNRHGVTMCAFLDALSHMLADSAALPLPELEATDPRLSAAIEQARQIDVERRNRD